MTPSSARILVVDDVPENRDLLARRLTRLGIEHIDQAANGLEALAAIAANAYDVVLLDIMMPEMDGFGVLEELRKSGRSNDLPVIVISAMSEMDAVVRCVELGAEDFLFKPFNPTLLRARVLATLEKKALRDGTREELRRKQIELNEARTLQLALAPPAFSGDVGGLQLAIDVVLDPAKEVGGDLVDYFVVDNGLLVLELGDVSDKGAGAALMMARTHSMFRSLATRPDARALFREPARAVRAVNDSLAQGNDTCMFVTLFLATLDPQTRTLSYVRAGHVPPLHRSTGRPLARLTGAGGPPIGLVKGFEYRQEAIELKDGDCLLAVTDGFVEANNSEGELFGEARLETFLTELDPREARNLPALVRQVRDYEAGLPAFDDKAAILLTMRAPVS